MIIFLFGLALSVLLLHQFWWRRRGLPPGPVPLPIIGNVHSLWNYERWEDKFLKWTKEYGPIYTYWLGMTPIISVNTYEKAFELFVKDGEFFADRAPVETVQKALNGGIYGVFATSGPRWVEQRRFAIKVLRDFGLDKSKMQDRILEEFETIYEHIQNDIKMGVEEHDPHLYIDIGTGSVITAVLLGFRFTTNRNEAKFYTLKKVTTDVMKVFADPLFLLSMNSKTMIKLPVFKNRFQRMVDLLRKILCFMDQIVEEHEKQLDDDSIEPRDLVDAYLLEWRRLDKQGAHHYFSRVQLISLLKDFWFAGQETTSNTITWALAYMIDNQEVQKKVHDELNRVIGSDRLITCNDRQSLPFTNAFIMETQRCANTMNQGVLRKASKDVQIDGILIPKGASILPQIGVFFISPENFKDPQTFDPSRFIDENGQLKRCDELVPFSLGKRACAGEGLARMELFLFLANLFNRFKFMPGRENPTFKKIGGGGGFAIEPYKCKIESRY